MKTLYYFNKNDKLPGRAIARIRFSANPTDLAQTEILFIGFIPDSGLKFGIYNLRFTEQTLFDDFYYKKLLRSVMNWFTEITADDFNNYYNEACMYILD